MIGLVLNKIIFILFFLSTLNVIRHLFLFLLKISDQDRYKISNTSLIYLGLSLSMILTSLFTGIKI